MKRIQILCASQMVTSHRGAASLEKRGCEGAKGGWVRREGGGTGGGTGAGKATRSREMIREVALLPRGHGGLPK
jgi:hypothetical protein